MSHCLYCFLTGNADMHRKNFSLLHTLGLGYGLAPAYNLVATALVNPADPEELVLTLNSRK
jgi:serine/threonine-protein kinase HipA